MIRRQREQHTLILFFIYTYKASNGIQLYNTPWFCCGLLTDDVEHLPNIFLKWKKKKSNIFMLFEHYYFTLFVHSHIQLVCQLCFRKWNKCNYYLCCHWQCCDNFSEKTMSYLYAMQERQFLNMTIYLCKFIHHKTK